MKDLKHLNKYLLKYKYHLLLGTIFIIISNVFGIAPAIVVREALDLVKANIDTYSSFEGFEMQNEIYGMFAWSVMLAGVIILVLAVLRGLFLFLTRQTIIVMSRLIEYDLKNEIYEHYQTLPLSFYRKNNTGDLLARISEDVSRVRMYVGPAIMYGINLVSLFLLVIPYMFSVNPKLALFALIPLPILSVSIYFVNNLINRQSEEIQRSLSSLSTFVQEAFSGIRVIKAFGREKDSVRNFSEQSEVYRIKSIRLAFIHSLFFPLIVSMIGLSTILTIFIGGIEVINGWATIGNIAEFVIYVSMLTWPVTSLGWVTSIIQRAAASQKRVNEFLEQKTAIVSSLNLQTDIEGHLQFKNVDFVYEDSGIQALKGVSFKVEPGESVAIIGTTGSGKSTIANLICRMYEPTGGSIEVDQRAIEEYGLANLRAQIGYVPQDVFLFSETIAKNITFGNGDLPMDKVLKAAGEADLTDVESFTDGFSTRIGERGITLSGGQKQRVSIARAIAREPKILILDDCLSAVDTKTENTILNSMKRIMKGRTTVIISHRVSSAKLANRILVLDDGKLIEQGTHKELLKTGGPYRWLYEKQLMAEELTE